LGQHDFRGDGRSGGGYALGGWLADRSPSATVLYFAISGSGSTNSSLFLWCDPYYDGLAVRRVFGTAVASLIIFAPTMTALAITGPFVIRLLARAGHIGVTAGKVYALSTAGSIAGVLITSFFLVPRFGTRMTLQISCAVTLIVGGGTSQSEGRSRRGALAGDWSPSHS